MKWKSYSLFSNLFFGQQDRRYDVFEKVFLKPDGRLTDPKLFSDQRLIAGTDTGSPISATPATFEDSRLKSLFNELPNKCNNAFIGMAKKINKVKDCMFTPGCIDIQEPALGTTKADVDKNLNYRNDM